MSKMEHWIPSHEGERAAQRRFGPTCEILQGVNAPPEGLVLSRWLPDGHHAIWHELLRKKGLAYRIEGWRQPAFAKATAGNLRD